MLWSVKAGNSPPRGSDSEEAPRSWTILAIAAIVGLGVLTYGVSIGAPFVLDDWACIVVDANNQVHRLWPWGPPPVLGRCFGTWTFQLNYALHGLNLIGWHVTNIAIHLLAACALFGLVRRTLRLPGIPEFLSIRGEWLALSASLLWLAHPLQTQAVTYIVQRYESLMALGYLLTLYCLVRGAQSSFSSGWYVASVAACWVGAASKEVMVSAPLVALLFDRAYLAASWGEVFRRRWGLYVGLLATIPWLIYASMQAMTGNTQDGAGFDQPITPWQYLRSQPAVLLHYLGLAVWPRTLTIDYGWPVETSPWRIYGLGLIILSLAVASLWALWRYPRVGVIAAAFFLILAPTSSFLPIADLAFEHRMYLPLACLIVLALTASAYFVTTWIPHVARQKRVLYVATALAVALLALRTVARNNEYRNPIAMWERMVAVNPGHARHYNVLARLYTQAGRSDDAYAKLIRLTELVPDHPFGWSDLAKWHFARGDYASAKEAYRRAIQLMPDLFSAHLNLARCEMLLGDYAAALAESKAALSLRPDSELTIKQIAWLLATTPDDSIRNGPEAVRLLRSIPQRAAYFDLIWHDCYAAALAESGKYDEAVQVTQDALVHLSSPNHAAAANEMQQRLKSYQAREPWRITTPPRPPPAA